MVRILDASIYDAGLKCQALCVYCMDLHEMLVSNVKHCMRIGWFCISCCLQVQALVCVLDGVDGMHTRQETHAVGVKVLDAHEDV